MSNGLQCSPLASISSPEAALPQSKLVGLRDRVLSEIFRGRQIEVDVLARRTAAVEPVAQGKEILPLGVGTRGIHGRNRHARSLESVDITDQGDHAVALGDIFRNSLDERAQVSLLEILLDLDFAPDGPEIAGELASRHSWNCFETAERKIFILMDFTE